MKKSTIIIALGFFIVITAFLGMNNEKMYQKQKRFETSSEVFQQIDNKSLKVIDEKGDCIEINDLRECLSERKRLTESKFEYGKIEIETVEELGEKQKRSILKEYEQFRGEFSKRRAITKEEPIRLNATVYNNYYEMNGTVEYGNPQKIKLDFVLIDEGEGLVIDYIMENHSDRFDEEGEEDA